jgi:hypothetical protein
VTGLIVVELSPATSCLGGVPLVSSLGMGGDGKDGGLGFGGSIGVSEWIGTYEERN